MSNEQVEKFAIRFVPANRGVRAETNIGGCVVFPHEDGEQPAPWSTHMCSNPRRLRGKAVMFIYVHEQVAPPNPPQGRSNREHGKRHEGKRRDKKHGDKRGERNAHGKPDRDDNRPLLMRSSGPKVEEKRKNKPATAADAFDRAKAHLTFQPGEVKLDNLRVVYAHKLAQADQTAIGIRTDMARMVARIEHLQQQLSGAAAVIGEHLQEEGCDLAGKLYHARKEREQLKLAQAALSTERLAALGKLGKKVKALKAAGDPSAASEETVLEAVKEGFAKQQAPLSAKIAANKLLIEGTKGEWKSGLEEKVRWEVSVFETPEEEERIFKAVMQAVEDAFTINGKIVSTKNSLVGQVNAYEKRLAALA